MQHKMNKEAIKAFLTVSACFACLPRGPWGIAIQRCQTLTCGGAFLSLVPIHPYSEMKVTQVQG